MIILIFDVIERLSTEEMKTAPAETDYRDNSEFDVELRCIYAQALHQGEGEKTENDERERGDEK